MFIGYIDILASDLWHICISVLSIQFENHFKHLVWCVFFCLQSKFLLWLCIFQIEYFSIELIDGRLLLNTKVKVAEEIETFA